MIKLKNRSHESGFVTMLLLMIIVIGAVVAFAFIRIQSKH